MANEVTRPILEKVFWGRPLTDKELKTVINFYTDLSSNLDMASFVEKGYTFSANHARQELKRLKTFADKRGMDY